jgi:hypothetical protein
MQKDIEPIYQKIRELETQLEDYLAELREEFNYTLHNGKVKFDEVVRSGHRQLKVGLLAYIFNAKLAHVVTAPVIYALFFPLLLLDITINIYQQICFRAYGIPRVTRWDYMLVDRNQLAYLNVLEKFNCVYCSYGNGLIAFSREVLARTEQYWYPIKHASRVQGAHSRYGKFVEYGDGENYRAELAKARDDVQSGDSDKT